MIGFLQDSRERCRPTATSRGRGLCCARVRRDRRPPGPGSRALARPGAGRLALPAILALSLGFTPAPVARANPVVQAVVAADAALVAATARLPGQMLPTRVSVATGRFDVVHRRDLATTGGFEYRGGSPLWWRLRPEAGVAATTDGGAFVYAGLRYSYSFDRHWRLAADMGLAAYHRGAGKRLGSHLLGRSGFAAGWCEDAGRCLMLGFHHMSHSRFFSHYNPGVEILRLSLVWPLGPG